jgi:NAD(P)-dependent dehydrogenase (short-subunit alcohol dehydrogenase family)
MKIAVIDGQGGGIGKTIIEKLKLADIKNVHILALGTNSAATALMKKAGADEGATGENAIVYNMKNVDVVMGVIAILNANSMLGELSPAIASSVGESKAKKILLPINRCGIHVVGIKDMSLSSYIDEAILEIKSIAKE